LEDGLPYLLGKRRGLMQCATATGRFVVLALDHRQNLRRELRPEAPDAVTPDEMVLFKLAVVRSLAETTSGILLDPEVGVGQALAAGAIPGATGLIVAVEATGYDGAPGARTSRILPGWSVSAAKRIGASAVKLLVYYHPEAPTAEAQERLVADVAAECRREDLALFLEPLSYGLDGGKLVGEERRRVVVDTARRLTATGADVLKAEFPYDAGVTDVGRWRDACAELDEATPIPWVLLSGGVDDVTFEAQVATAGDAGASGALVGRSVWADAATLAEPERTATLRSAGRARMERLAAIIEEHERPWEPRWSGAMSPEMPADGWYARPAP
jgi:tagatose 1,6-diphosphate aldolase